MLTVSITLVIDFESECYSKFRKMDMELALFYRLTIYKDNFVRVQKILLQVKLKRKDLVSVFLYNIHTWNANLYAKHLMGYYSAADVRQYSSIHTEY